MDKEYWGTVLFNVKDKTSILSRGVFSALKINE